MRNIFKRKRTIDELVEERDYNDRTYPFHTNAVDRNGKRYTTHTFADNNDWWYGVSILTPTCIVWLKKEGLLPLTEVNAERYIQV